MAFSRHIFSRHWWTSSVSRRIGLIIVMTVVLMLIAILFSMRGLSVLNRQLDHAVEQQSRAARLVGEMLQESQHLSDSARRAAAASTPEDRALALQELEASKKSLGERVDEISAQLNDAPELQTALREGFSSFVISAVKAGRLMQANRQQDAERELLNGFDPKLLSYVLMSVGGVTEHTERTVKSVAESGHAVYTRTLSILIPMLLAVVIAVVAGHWLLRRTVVKPVQRVAQAASLLARGQFDLDLSSDAHDECGEMLRAMTSLREQLAQMIGAIQATSASVAHTADELAGSNQDLSARTGDQAIAFRQASRALADLNSMARQSAQSAQRVSRDMQSAFGAAQEGRSVINDVASTMQATAEASRRIADTVGMIDEIAFKTNILALNAAVEAARAGEHGRSFAVVAAEVRALASKCAAAAKEITSLIAHSSETVTQGTKLVTRAGAAIENLVTQVQAAAARVDEISQASLDQSRRADEVTTAIAQIDAGTQQNAEMASDATHAMQSLLEEARALAASAAAFSKVDSAGGAPHRVGETSEGWEAKAA
jgi:methyl-accepting chemotaxis protein